jgi:hypothetical protein
MQGQNIVACGSVIGSTFLTLRLSIFALTGFALRLRELTSIESAISRSNRDIENVPMKMASRHGSI